MARREFGVGSDHTDGDLGGLAIQPQAPMETASKIELNNDNLYLDKADS